MAKNYSATLQLKDANMVNTLKKASQAAKDLQKSLQAISKTPVTINAKLGSSFKNVEANINRITPKSKTIKIEATENVTKTINNVQRSVFEMSNKMNSTINSTMKGFSANLKSLNNPLKNYQNYMSKVMGLGKSIAGNAAASSIGAGVGAGVGAAAILGKGKKGFIDRIQIKTEADNTLKPTITEAFTGGIRDAYKKWKGIHNSYAEKLQQGEGTSSFISFDSSLGKLINKQKAALGKLYGGQIGSLYLSDKYKRIPTQINQNGSRAKGNVDGYLSRFGNKIDTFNLGFQGGKGGFGAPDSKGIYKFGESIGKAAAKVDNLKQKIKGLSVVKFSSNMFKSIEYQMTKLSLNAHKMWFAIQRGAYHVGAAAFTITKPFATAFNYVKKSATSSFNQIRTSGSSTASRLGSYFIRSFANVGSGIYKVFRFAFTKIKTDSDGTARRVPRAWVSAIGSISKSIVSGIGGAFKKLTSIASKAAKAIGAAFTAAVGLGVKDMANQEEYITSMTHFISVDDAKANGTNTITMDEAKQRAEGLFEWGTDFANKTPFGNAEVYEAINRMTQVFGYGKDGSDVQKMVKLVGDMAALNPGKTMSDAAEAIADLAMGETERMKEFGLKLTQDDLKALAGVPDQSDSLSQEQIMKAFSELSGPGGQLFETFDGGADALSQTMAGKWSTFTGQFRQMMVEAVKPFEGIIKGALDGAITFINGDFANKFKGAFSTVASFMGDLMAGDSSNFPIIDNLINAFNTLRDAIVPIVDTVIEQYSKIFDSCSESFGGMGGIIEGTASVIGDILTGLAPILELAAPIFNTLKETAIAVWPVIQGVIDVASQIIKDCVEKLQPVFDAVDQVIQVIGQTVADIWPSIQETILNVWDNLQPALDLFGSLCQLIADIFTVAWPPIAGVLETLWEIASPIFEGISGLLGDICGWLDKAVQGFSDMLTKVKESKWNPFNWFGGGDEDGSNAFGLDRVPFDGYKAVLHEGERVLTARQARELDNGVSSSVSNNITVNVNGAQDARSVANEVVRELKAIIPNMA